MWRTFYTDIVSDLESSINKLKDQFLDMVEQDGYDPRFINLVRIDGYGSRYRFFVTARKKGV